MQQLRGLWWTARRWRVGRQRAGSPRLTIEIRREGSTWTQDYVASRPATEVLPGPPSTESGTMLTFWADPDIFETTQYDFETLSRPLPGDGVPQ